MPQLDTFAYMSQVVWLVVCFFTMYIYLVRVSLPRIYKILYVRRYKLLGYSKSIKALDVEIFSLGRVMVSSNNNVVGVVYFLPIYFSNIKATFVNKALSSITDWSYSFIDLDEYILEGLNVIRLPEDVVYLETRLGEELKKRILIK